MIRDLLKEVGGTVTARNPDLIYHKRDKHLEFSGGSYLIRKEGIDL